MSQEIDLEKFMRELPIWREKARLEHEAFNAALEVFNGFVSAGAVVQHTKSGGLYRIINLGRQESTLTTQVVYVSLDPEHPIPWIRPLLEFTDGRFVAYQVPEPEIEEGANTSDH